LKYVGILIFWLILSSAGTLSAQQARFDQATALLDQQEYREALEAYKSIAGEGYSSGALWLNMGTAYARLDSLGMAKYYLLKAERHSETRELARESLTYVDDRFSRRSAVLPPLPWERFFENLSHNVGVSVLTVLSFIALYLGVAALIVSWFLVDYRKWLYYPGLIALALAALLFACTFYLHYLENRYGTAVMTDRQSTVYTQPEPDSPAVSTAYEGYTMRVDYNRTADRDDWLHVRLENGMRGWIDRNAVHTF
jgi:tetratricopeptide (TPR) repeat protein